MTQVHLISEEVEQMRLVESKTTKDLYVEGIYSTAEMKNKNGRRYKKETLSREIERLQEDLTQRRLFGELNHPKSPEINLEKVAILVETLNWKGNDLYGRAVVVDTPMGNIAKALMKKGSIGISSRGLGSVNENGYVNDSTYKLITWDLVSNPSNHPSWVNGIYEGRQWDLTTDFEEEIIDSVAQNKGMKISEATDAYGDYLKEFLNKVNNRL